MLLGSSSGPARSDANRWTREVGMASVTQNFMKFFRSSSSGPEATNPAQSSQKLTRRSSGLGELARSWDSKETLCVLDLGSTSAINIRHFTERGHKIYSEDLLTASTEPHLVTKDEPGGMLLAFFHTRDAGPDSPCYRFHIIGQDTLEMQRIVLRREARRGPTGAVHSAITNGFQLQRVFNNRHIENLFRDFASIKFFLARDNVRED